jgi:putative glutamine amidotransferase
VEPRAGPSIVVTVSVPTTRGEASIVARKNALYAGAIREAGGTPVLLSSVTVAADREAAFAEMDGLLLSGGADIEPARYGAEPAGSTGVEPERDALEAAAFAAAEARGLPVLGVCRGFQAINVFRGGTILQHVDGHAGPGYGQGPAARHHLRVDPTSRLAGWIAAPPDDGLEVNSYHHQAVRPADLAPGLRPSAWADSPIGQLVEAFEAPGERFVVGVQCHPERLESTPAGFVGLWRAFIDACREARAPT